MDEDEKFVIDSLDRLDKADADVVSCIEILEVLLSVEALPALLRFMVNSPRAYNIRVRAAQAIREIGSSYVRDELFSLLKAGPPELHDLARIALGQSRNS